MLANNGRDIPEKSIARWNACLIRPTKKMGFYEYGNHYQQQFSIPHFIGSKLATSPVLLLVCSFYLTVLLTVDFTSFESLWQSCLAAFVHPVAISSEVDCRSVVEETIERCSCHHRVAEDSPHSPLVLLLIRMVLPRSYLAVTNWKNSVPPTKSSRTYPI
jgi:hypothetical protein